MQSTLLQADWHQSFSLALGKEKKYVYFPILLGSFFALAENHILVDMALLEEK